MVDFTHSSYHHGKDRMHMFKKQYIIWLLLLVLVLCACGAETAFPETPGEPDTWTMNFPGLEWGMTQEEVIAALSLKEGDYERKEDSEMIRLEGVRMTLFGGEKSFSVFYFDDGNGDGVYTLCRAVTLYPDGADMEKIKAEMTKWYGDPSEDSGSKTLWNSQASHQDIMTPEDKAILEEQSNMAGQLLTNPITTVSWTTNAYFDYPLDGGTTKNELTFSSSVAFYTKEGGYAAQQGAA